MNTALILLNQISLEWSDRIVHASVGGATAAALVWIGLKLMPKLNPTFQVWAWRLVFLKFLFALAWVNPLQIPVLTNYSPQAQIAEDSALPGITQPVASTDKTQAATEAPVNPISRTSLLFLIWACGVAAISFHVLRQVVSAAKKRRTYTAIENQPLNAVLENLSEEFSTRIPALVTCPHSTSPYLTGIVRPTIVIPKAFLSTYSERELGLILAHELAHLKMRHLAWSWLPTAGFILFFFHPLLWLAYRELQFAQELQADERALSHSRGTPQVYGETLLKIIRQQRLTLEDALVTVRVVESYQTLKRRILTMNHLRPITRKAAVAAGVTFLIAGAFGIIPWQLVASASGTSFAAKCADLGKCIKAVSEITGDKYLYDSDIKGAIAASDNVTLTPENATLLLTKALALNGFTRVPVGEANTYEIMRQRDARDTLLPKVTADAKSAPEMPNTWDLYQMTFQAKHKSVVEHMARTARSFMPANSRIIPVEFTGQVIVTAAVPEIRNVYEIIRQMDVKPTEEMLTKWWKEMKREEERARDRRAQSQTQGSAPAAPQASAPSSK